MKGLTNNIVHMPRRKYVYMLIFRFVGVSVIEIREFENDEEHGKTVKYHITSITHIIQIFSQYQ